MSTIYHISRTIGRSAGSLSLGRDVSAWNWSQPNSHHSAYWSRSAEALEALSSLNTGLVPHGNLKAFKRCHDPETGAIYI